jgi:hypothetical protein
VIVSLTAYNRPDYLEQVLESLEVAISYCPEPVFLVSSVDGPASDVQAQILDMLPGDDPGNHKRDHKYLSTENLGLQKNTLRALDEAWGIADGHGEDFLLHLEDDLVLAPDALRMACWMRDAYRDDPETGFISLTNVHNDEPENWAGAYRSPWFECHLWGTWRPIWDNLMRPDWPHGWFDHWAAMVNDQKMWGLLQAIPNLSRSKSIGEFGVHSNSEYHVLHNPKHYAGDALPALVPPTYKAEFNVPVR